MKVLKEDICYLLLFVVVVVVAVAVAAAAAAAAAAVLCTSRSAQHHSLKLYLGLHVSLTRRAHPRVRQLPEAQQRFHALWSLTMVFSLAQQKFRV